VRSMFGENISIVAAHPDDEVIGMGGTIKKLTSQGKNVSVLFLSDGVSSRENLRESAVSRRESAVSALGKLDCFSVDFAEFPDNKLDSVPLLDICKVIEGYFVRTRPNAVFTHFPFDLNIDHRVVSEAVSVASRPKKMSTIQQLFFFEVLSSTGWKFGDRTFNPSLFIEIEQEFSKKVASLKEYYIEMESYPDARSLEAVEALAILRGSTVGNRKSEAFEIGFIRS